MIDHIDRCINLNNKVIHTFLKLKPTTTKIRSTSEIKDEPPIHEQQTDTVEVDKLLPKFRINLE